MTYYTNNILSIDWGKKKLGLAKYISHINTIYPLGYIPNDNQTIQHISHIIQSEYVSSVVIGYPLSQDDICRYIDIFISQLSICIDEQISIYKQDESYTSIIADTTLQTQKITASYGQNDSISAMIILQRFLETK